MTLATLLVKDEIVVAFFTSAIAALTLAVTVLWNRMNKCEADREALWRKFEAR